MATHLSESGFDFPSIRPGISANCLRTSETILKAALPTAVMVMEAIRKGRIPPTKNPITTSGFKRLINSNLTA